MVLEINSRYSRAIKTISLTKVIVTGGAGFIGSHLADALLERGFEVRVIDNFATGKRENLNSKAILHEIDIRDYEKLLPVFQGIDYVFHMAALARVQPSIEDPKTSEDVNVMGTLNVLLAAREGGVKRVIYSASSSAYGEQETLPFKEDMTPHPISPYALQKYVGELWSALFSKIYGLQTVSLRYFNVYGPRAPGEGAYALATSRFLSQRKRGEPLTIVPDGRQSRDLVHVRDVVRANLLAMKSEKVGKGEIINIAAGKDYAVLELARLIGGPTVFIEPRIEPKHTLADISKAKDLLGWSPEIKFEDGVAELKKLHGLIA